MDIVEVANVFKRFKVSTLLFRVLSRPDVQAFIINLNTEDQLKTRNEDALGVKLYTIGGEYSIETQFLKGLGGKQVNLFDTGDYQESYAVIPLRNFSFIIDSDTTIHGDDLKDRWGENIEGINKENLEKLNEFLAGKLLEEIASLL